MWVKRIGTGCNVNNGRLTVGKLYLLDHNFIEDDNGNSMEPCLPGKHCYKNDWWEMVPDVTQKQVTDRTNIMIRRIQRSARTTVGKVYQVYEDGKIIDDDGERYTPSLGDEDTCWEILPIVPPNNDWPLWPCGAGMDFFKSPKQQLKEEPKMVKVIVIKEATLINGNDSDEHPIEDLITMIRNEEGKIVKLEGVQADSKAIDKLKEGHKANIVALVKILDAKEE